MKSFFLCVLFCAGLAIAPIASQATAITTVAIGALSKTDLNSQSGHLDIHKDLRCETLLVCILTTQTMSEGPAETSSVYKNGTVDISSSALQKEDRVSRAELSTNIASAEDDNYRAYTQTYLHIAVANDTPNYKNLFYEFGLSGMVLDIQNEYGDGTNPFAELGYDGQTGIRISYVIFFANADDPSDFLIFDYDPFTDYDNLLYRAEMEIFTDFEERSGAVLKYGNVENMVVANTTPYEDVPTSWTSGFRVDIAPIVGVLDLGEVSPFSSIEMKIYSRVEGLSATREQILFGSIGDPSLDYSLAYEGTQSRPLPLPGTLPLVLLAGGALLASRRRKPNQQNARPVQF